MPTFALPFGTRNAMADAAVASINAGGGKLRLYTDVRPADPNDPVPGTAVLLGEVTLPINLFDAAVNGIAAAGLPIPSTVAVAGGVLSWFRVLDAVDVPLFDGDFGLIGSGAPIEVNTLTVVSGVALHIPPNSLSFEVPAYCP